MLSGMRLGYNRQYHTREYIQVNQNPPGTPSIPATQATEGLSRAGGPAEGNHFKVQALSGTFWGNPGIKGRSVTPTNQHHRCRRFQGTRGTYLVLTREEGKGCPPTEGEGVSPAHNPQDIMSYGPASPYTPRAGGALPAVEAALSAEGRRRLRRGAIPLPGADRALPEAVGAAVSACRRARARLHAAINAIPSSGDLPPSGVPPSTPGRGGRRGDPERSRRDRPRAAGDPRLGDLRLRRALRPQPRGCPGVPGSGGRRRRPPLGGPARRDSPHQEGVGASDRGLSRTAARSSSFTGSAG